MVIRREEIMDAIIMCAGRGNRLKPLTDDIPKCMIKVSGKPIIKWIYDNCIKAGIHPSIIISGYKQDILLEYANKNILGCMFINQSVINGTANAIHLAKGWVIDDFIVLSGDIIYSVEELEDLKKIKNSLTYTRMDERLYEYGTLEIVGNQIKHINEKSTEPSSKLVNCAGYHLTQDVFDYIEKTSEDSRFNEKIITNTINLMIDDGYRFKGIPIKYLNE